MLEKLTQGLSTTVIGMLVVFFGLVILIACIYAMTSMTGRKKKAPAPKQEDAPAPQEPVQEAEEEAQDDDVQLIAVISAAIAAVWDNEKSGFVVRRVKKIQNSTARARAARDEQIYSRL